MDHRDDSLAQIYRRTSHEEPSAQLDLAVLDMARKSARHRPRSRFGNPWLVGGALAAVALVGVVLVVLMREQPPLEVPDTSRLRDMDDEAIRLPLPPAGQRPARDPAAGMPVAAPQGAASPHTDAQALPSTATAPQTPAEAGPPQPRFDFYPTLPEQPPAVVPQPGEAAVSPAAPGQAPAAVPQPPPAAAAVDPEPQAESTLPATGFPDGPASAPATPAGAYYLQAGAFRAADSAGRFKARLEALGLPAGVEAIVLENRETWHRVRIGPYRDLAATDAVRDRLAAQGIDSMPVKTVP